jgi:hypothetical protein
VSKQVAQKDAILAWHFVKDDCYERFGDSPQLIAPGRVYEVNGPVNICTWGLHGSLRALDALSYAPGSQICRVRLWGDVEEDHDKLVATHREVLAMADATRTLHEFAIRCARQALALAKHPDQRSLRALEVKRLWLDGKATDEELDSAWVEAEDVAKIDFFTSAWVAAKVSAGVVAKITAWTAAELAAWGAADVAAGVAAKLAVGDADLFNEWSGARDAAMSAHNAELERRLCALLEVQP